MERTRIFSLILCSSLWAWAADPAPESQQPVDTSTTQEHALQNIDIFGENVLTSIGILWDDVDIHLDVKKSIQEKKFATDEFYMQNIDREQFEQERILKLFDEKKKNFLRLFPDMEEEESLD